MTPHNYYDYNSHDDYDDHHFYRLYLKGGRLKNRQVRRQR